MTISYQPGQIADGAIRLESLSTTDLEELAQAADAAFSDALDAIKRGSNSGNSSGSSSSSSGSELALAAADSLRLDEELSRRRAIDLATVPVPLPSSAPSDDILEIGLE